MSADVGLSNNTVGEAVNLREDPAVADGTGGAAGTTAATSRRRLWGLRRSEHDVTELLRRAARSLEPGDLLESSGFSLQDAMLAVEIGDERMDAGHRLRRVAAEGGVAAKDADELLAEGAARTDLQLDEIALLGFHLLSCAATWMKGASLPQSVGSSLHYLRPETPEGGRAAGGGGGLGGRGRVSGAAADDQRGIAGGEAPGRVGASGGEGDGHEGTGQVPATDATPAGHPAPKAPSVYPLPGSGPAEWPELGTRSRLLWQLVRVFRSFVTCCHDVAAGGGVADEEDANLHLYGLRLLDAPGDAARLDAIRAGEAALDTLDELRDELSMLSEGGEEDEEGSGDGQGSAGPAPARASSLFWLGWQLRLMLSFVRGLGQLSHADERGVVLAGEDLSRGAEVVQCAGASPGSPTPRDSCRRAAVAAAAFCAAVSRARGHPTSGGRLGKGDGEPTALTEVGGATAEGDADNPPPPEQLGFFPELCRRHMGAVPPRPVSWTEPSEAVLYWGETCFDLGDGLRSLRGISDWSALWAYLRELSALRPGLLARSALHSAIEGPVRRQEAAASAAPGGSGGSGPVAPARTPSPPEPRALPPWTPGPSAFRASIGIPPAEEIGRLLPEFETMFREGSKALLALVHALLSNRSRAHRRLRDSLQDWRVLREHWLAVRGAARAREAELWERLDRARRAEACEGLAAAALSSQELSDRIEVFLRSWTYVIQATHLMMGFDLELYADHEAEDIFSFLVRAGESLDRSRKVVAGSEPPFAFEKAFRSSSWIWAERPPWLGPTDAQLTVGAAGQAELGGDGGSSDGPEAGLVADAETAGLDTHGSVLAAASLRRDAAGGEEASAARIARADHRRRGLDRLEMAGGVNASRAYLAAAVALGVLPGWRAGPRAPPRHAFGTAADRRGARFDSLVVWPGEPLLMTYAPPGRGRAELVRACSAACDTAAFAARSIENVVSATASFEPAGRRAGASPAAARPDPPKLPARFRPAVEPRAPPPPSPPSSAWLTPREIALLEQTAHALRKTAVALRLAGAVLAEPGAAAEWDVGWVPAPPGGTPWPILSISRVGGREGGPAAAGP